MLTISIITRPKRNRGASNSTNAPMCIIHDLITDDDEEDNEDHDYVCNNEDFGDDSDSWNSE